MQAGKEAELWMYEKMLEIRHFEETMATVYLEGKLPPQIQKGLAFDIGSGPVPGEMHLAAGQEPVAVGVCAHLKQTDTVVGTHRPHHFAIAKGVPLGRMAAEMFGKATGLGKGKGGHMHLFDPVNRFSCSGIIGASLPPACGAGLAAKKLGKDWVAVAFFGEGAANQGAVHESLNLAALWKLPVIFVCEDNKWAISVPKSSATSIEWVADRAAGYGMPGIKVATNDAMAVYEAAGPAVQRARRGWPAGPEPRLAAADSGGRRVRRAGQRNPPRSVAGGVVHKRGAQPVAYRRPRLGGRGPGHHCHGRVRVHCLGR